MAKTVSVNLSEPLVGHDGEITVLELREPKFGLFRELGDPVDLVRMADGHVVQTINHQVLGDYAERCAPDGVSLLLNQLNLRDTLAVQEAVLGFFTEARAEPHPIANSPPSSSLTSEPRQAPSTV